MLGYVHLLPETRPALERRTVAGTALWVLEGDLDGGLLPSRRLRRWTRRLAECGVSHAALPPGREGDFAPLRPVLPDGLRLALRPQAFRWHSQYLSWQIARAQEQFLMKSSKKAARWLR